MDPVTAINNGIAAVCNLLSTPQGQLVMADLRTLNKDFTTMIGNLIAHIHSQVAPKPPTT